MPCPESSRSKSGGGLWPRETCCFSIRNESANVSQPLPFGVAREQVLDCKIGDWVVPEAAPGWDERHHNQSIRPTGDKRLAKPWLFIPVVHVSPAGEQKVWKRMM